MQAHQLENVTLIQEQILPSNLQKKAQQVEGRITNQIYYSPETSHLTELSTFAEDLSFLEVLDSRTTHTGKYPGKTGERTGKGNGPGKAKQQKKIVR